MKRYLLLAAVAALALVVFGCASDDAVKEQLNAQATKIAQLETKLAEPTPTPPSCQFPVSVDRLFVKELRVDDLSASNAITASKSLNVGPSEGGMLMAKSDKDGPMLSLIGKDGKGAMLSNSTVFLNDDSTGGSLALSASNLMLLYSKVLRIVLGVTENGPILAFNDTKGNALGGLNGWRSGSVTLELGDPRGKATVRYSSDDWALQLLTHDGAVEMWSSDRSGDYH